MCERLICRMMGICGCTAGDRWRGCNIMIFFPAASFCFSCYKWAKYNQNDSYFSGQNAKSSKLTFLFQLLPFVIIMQPGQFSHQVFVYLNTTLLLVKDGFVHVNLRCFTKQKSGDHAKSINWTMYSPLLTIFRTQLTGKVPVYNWKHIMHNLAEVKQF